MSYKVLIRNNETREERLCGVSVVWTSHSLFWWTDGNMSCDCNRRILFDRIPVGEDVPCSDGAYTVLYALLPNGTRIPIEDTETMPKSDASAK